ncbi:carbonic anhydrase [Gemmatimonas sp.]|uniref:carbonic anhydrase n=1 Tax=Gemmatimonas sp. TaxID=1962908 RepID=UPI00286BA3BE|nr:carbonic anhydrase [Gemmatimonas sp.]
MEEFRRIIEGNRVWAARVKAENPDFFSESAQGQQPLFLYIGCADSRVPANSITGTKPGELFVHRNIANLVMPSDINAMSVLQYAVEVLDVKHVIVTGHYGCGGVKAAMSDQQHGLVDHWLGPIRNVLRWNKEELDAIADPQARFDRLVELNVLEQLYHLSETPIIQQAWARGRRPLLHGLVYSLKDGILHELATGIDSQDAADHLADRRLSGVAAGPPPIGRVAAPILAGESLADEIAMRVIARMSEASEKRPQSR